MTTTFPHKDFNKAFQLHSKGRVVRSISIVLIFLLPETLSVISVKNVQRILSTRFHLSMKHLYKQVDGPIKKHVSLACGSEIGLSKLVL